jgi:class 3 adenylate cyclase
MVNLPTATMPATTSESTSRKARRWHIAVMSGSDTKGRWRISSKTTAVAVMGGCELDLRRAEIESDEIVITAFAFWGGIKILVPEGFDVDLEGFSFMGGRSLRMRDVPRVPGSPRIRIRGFAVMAGIDVRSRPNRSGRQAIDSLVEGVRSVVDAIPDRYGATGEIDLAALGADIRRQIKAHHRGTRPPRIDVTPSQPVPEPPAQAMPSDGTVTILFSDMVDYAGMTERLGDQASREVLREHHRIVRNMLDRHGGREISVQGDGFMVAFGGVARALRCAIEVQRAFRSYSEDNLDRPIQVHIGVHTGDAVEEDDDFLGHTVIVASRLAAVAAPGEILVSSLSEQLVQGSGEFTFVEHRESALKGMTRVQHAAALAWAD